jgi:DNA-binding LytR/AlgR family response regulator
MEKFNCIIVEDEPLAAEVLEDYIKQVPFFHLRKVCADAMLAIETLRKEKIDVIFLDIHLPGLKGLDFLKTLQKPIQVILTTAYREYALEGYELNVVDYLLKPISFNRFLMAINKLKSVSTSEMAPSTATINEKEHEHFFVNVNKKRIKIYLQDILYIESKREYISIVTKHKSHLVKFQMREIEEQLTGNHFMRVHRSFIVSKEKITAFSASEIEISGFKIPIGRSYKEWVLSHLGEPI